MSANLPVTIGKRMDNYRIKKELRRLTRGSMHIPLYNLLRVAQFCCMHVEELTAAVRPVWRLQIEPLPYFNDILFGICDPQINEH